mgnify:CR=1 FL=1
MERNATDAHDLLHGRANRFLTALSNLLAGLMLTDMMRCYKLMPKHQVEQITVTENRFGIEPEMTAKIAHMKPKLRLA